MAERLPAASCAAYVDTTTYTNTNQQKLRYYVHVNVDVISHCFLLINLLYVMLGKYLSY